MEKSKGEYQIAVKSPNERLELTFELLKGVPHYSISRDHRVLIDSSSMMIRINDEHASPVWRAEREQRTHHDEQWKPVWGIVDEVRNHYHELKIFLADGSKVDSSMNIVFRLFDDGAAFRYEWPDRNNEHKLLEIHEESAFQMDNDRCWFSVEGEEIQSMNEGGIRLQAFKGGHTPMTIELSQKCYIAIHEADVQNYELSELLLDQQSFQLIMKASSKAIAPHQSPWRTMTIVDRPGQLVTSHLIENLNPSSVIADTSWIRPGKSMWDWRNHGSVSGDFVYGLNTASMKRYIDFASTHNFQFLLIDAGWYGDEHEIHSDPTSCIEDVDIQEIIGYAAGKGIGVWLYINDKALKHFDMDHTLAAYREWGIAGIKHGFLQSVGQDRVEFTRKVVAACAAHQLMYVPHEPARPWGLHRTYPNFMSCEFINGQYDGPKRPEASPAYLCTVPFTNNLAAPLDRSSGMFDLDRAILRSKVHKEAVTTIASQLAQCFIIHTGFLTVPDHPESYQTKSDLFEFLRMMPVTWNETRVIHDDIAECVTIARRSGTDWFVASLTNELERMSDIPFDFLDKGEYQLTVYKDGPLAHHVHNREDYQIESLCVCDRDSISVRLAPGGGCAMWIRRLE